MLTAGVVSGLRLAWWLPVVTLLWKSRPWELDLLAHFTPHLVVVSALTAAHLLLFRRTRRLGYEGAAAAILTLGLVLLANFPPGPSRPAPPSTVPLRLVIFNTDAHVSSRDFPAYEWIRRQDADIVVVIDPPPNIDGEANWLLDKYPHRHVPAEGFMWAVKIYSSHPMQITPLPTTSDQGWRSFAAHRARTVTLPDGTQFLLSAMHPYSPRQRGYVDDAVRVVTLDGTLIRNWVESTGRPAILAGDFNTSPTGRVHRALARASGLRTYPSILSRGTWPARLPTWLSVPIDRVWVTPDVRIIDVTVGPRFLSGHRPVAVDLALPARSSTDAKPHGPDQPSRP